MITDDERFIRIQKILTWSDIHPSDCVKINDLIIELSKENQQLKEVIEEVREELELAYKELHPNELVNGRVIIKNILQILDKGVKDE